ncbi:MAG: hypothetical protein ABI318_03010 [Chthoniobacteraceae bacterium]
MTPLPLNTLLQTELLTADGRVCAKGYLLMKETDGGNFYPKVTALPDAAPAQADILNHGKREIAECRKSEPGRMTEFLRLRLAE